MIAGIIEVMMMNRQLSAVFSSYETAQLAAKRVKEKFPDANAAAIAKNPDSREVSVPPTAFLDGTLGGAVIPATMTGGCTLLRPPVSGECFSRNLALGKPFTSISVNGSWKESLRS